MIFYDFEVFKFDWLVVLVDTADQSEKIIVNNPDQLKSYYQNNIDNIWIGYNSNGYDRYILKGILCDFSPSEVNDWIINKGEFGWQFSHLFNQIKLNSYDTQFNKLLSLKQLEAFMGHDIRETTVPFDIDRTLTNEELRDVIKYCKHDVYETIEVFQRTLEEFISKLSLIQEFKMPLSNIAKTKAQLSAKILNANNTNSRDDEMEISFVNSIKLSKYAFVKTWYENTRDYEETLETTVAGVNHKFAWGGLHGARENYHETGYFINMDVASMYPAIMIEYDFLSRNVADPKKFRKIRDERLILKAQKNPLQQPYKIVLNSTYGASKDKYNGLYDPRQANNVCVNGQLLLLDLIEKLEPYCELVQSNTDGILIKCNESDFDLIDDIAYEWEQRTGLELEFEYFEKVFQKDVNNYIIVDFDGKYKSKGAYVKKLNELDYDLPIINQAVIDYFIKGKKPEDTINNCQKLIDFQKVVKISTKYEYGVYGSEKLNEKVSRVFADKGGKRLVKLKDGVPNKIAYVPERCRIINTNIVDKDIPKWLDKQWYIDLAWKRINDFLGE